MAFDFSIGSIGQTAADLYGLKIAGDTAAAQEQMSQAAADRAFAQAMTARSYLQENQRSLLIMAAGAVILFALVWRSGKG